MSNCCCKCGKAGQAGARFCTGCGAMLGVTRLHGATVVAPPGSLPGSGSMSSATALRVQSAFGDALLRSPWVSPLDDFLQRELTILDIDVSDSMNKEYDGSWSKLQAAKRASTTMVISKGVKDPEDEIGLVTFNSRATQVMPLSPIRTHKPDIIAALQSMVADNGTDINEGLKAADTMLAWHRPDVVRRIVLLSDGLGGDPLRTAESLKSRGVVIDVIGIGDSPQGVDEKLLKAVASVVQGELRYRFIKDQQTLVNHYTILAGKTALGV